MLLRLRQPLLIFAAGFIALFLPRLGYAVWSGANKPVVLQRGNAFSGAGWEFGKGIKNYASYKRKRAVSVQAPAIGAGAGQKYEKVANIGLRSTEFEKEEARIRRLIGENDALIQFEQRHGLKGFRTLQLAIGVDPAAFDAFVKKVQTFGELTRLTINKSDKTNEYRDLQAKRRALEKTREALTALKQRDGEIRAMIELEQQILSLEQQIQGLGVSLGDFDAENEFVTVKLRLAESRVTKRAVKSFVTHAFDALAWTVFYYTLFWIGLAAFLVAVFLGLHLLRWAVKLFKAADAKLAKE
jgi:Domain of unknown function (DUF4349)